MDEYQERMIDKIKATSDLFSAVQTVGNRAVHTVGYNKPYTFSPDLTVSYELYTSGPAVPYHSQYYYLNEKELGEQVDREPGLSDEAWYWKKDELFCRIVIKENNSDVFILQGKEGFRCALKVDGPWEEKLMDWFSADGGVLK